MGNGCWRRTSKGWGELQHDLLQRVCNHLESDARWAVRHVSAQWRESSTGLAIHKCPIKSPKKHLCTKIAVLHNWREQEKFRNCSFSFVLTAPMVLEDLASLVKDLHSQLDNMTSCKVGVTVLVAQGSRHTELANSAKQVARFAQLLHLQQQLALRVSFEAATDTTILPPPGVLQQLQACLYQFDTYSIPTEQPAASRTLSAETNSKITYDHLWYLSNTNRKSICTFSISTDHDFEVSSSVKAGIIGALAPMMSTLTKLHLTIRDSFFLSTIDFQPLAQLGLLTDLALQIVHKVPTCCDGVLRSNRQTLQSVTLTAGSWTAATYGSLQHIAQLKVLTITIMEVDAAQAQALGGVKAELFRLTLHGAVSPEGI